MTEAFDPKELAFQFGARAAMMQENARTVAEYLAKLVGNQTNYYQLQQRIQTGDLAALTEMIQNFEKDDRELSQLAEVIRKF